MSLNILIHPVAKMKMKIIVALFVMTLFVCANADVAQTQVQVANSPPTIDNIATYRNYTNRSVNIPATSFSAYNNTRNVSIQVVVSDLNGYYDLQSVKVKIVYWDGSVETDFPRFGSDYVDADFEYSTLTQSIYRYNFNMSPTDPTRLGTESPPLYYRVKARVTDSQTVVTSDLSDAENADYTYLSELPSFGIDISTDKTEYNPGDPVSAVVDITKYSPPTPKDINMTFELIDPLGNPIDSLEDSGVIDDVLTRTPTLGIPSSAYTGTYYFRVTVSYPEGVTSSQKMIIVAPAGEEVTPGHGGHVVPTGEGIAPEVVQVSEVRFFNMPESISVFPGEERLVPVIIQSVGTAPALEISLEVDGIFPPILITPLKISSISPGSNGLFVFQLRIPQALAPGKYEFNVIAKQKGVAIAYDTFYLYVSEPSEEPEMAKFEVLQQEIENAFDTLRAVREELLRKQAGGIDVSDILSRLDIVEQYLELASSAFNNGLYDSAVQNLVRARQLILESVQKAGQLSLPAGWGIDLNLVIVFPVLIVVLLAASIRCRGGGPKQFKYLLEKEELKNLSRTFSRKR